MRQFRLRPRNVAGLGRCGRANRPVAPLRGAQPRSRGPARRGAGAGVCWSARERRQGRRRAGARGGSDGAGAVREGGLWRTWKGGGDRGRWFEESSAWRARARACVRTRRARFVTKIVRGVRLERARRQRTRRRLMGRSGTAARAGWDSGSAGGSAWRRRASLRACLAARPRRRRRASPELRQVKRGRPQCHQLAYAYAHA